MTALFEACVERYLFYADYFQQFEINMLRIDRYVVGVWYQG